jgi:hypothetical protein
MTTELRSAAASAIRLVIFILTPLNYGRLLLGKANSLLLHVIAEASPKSASMTHFNLLHCTAKNP